MAKLRLSIRNAMLMSIWKKLRRMDSQIKYVIETHLHADFVSGHHEIAARTGARIIFGEKAGVEFEHQAVRDGEEIKMGKVVLRFIETPGHTPEGICILVTDTESPDQPQKLLTGDTLFIGDVGRPDLAGGKGYTPQMMAEMMYDSLHGKLLKLPDEVEVYPAHGAGSMCGRNMSKETSSTIGEQRKFNYALKPMSKEEFVTMMTADLPEAPSYFPKDAEINRSGARELSELQPPQALTPQQALNCRTGRRSARRSIRRGFRRRTRSGFSEHRTRRTVCDVGRQLDPVECRDRDHCRHWRPG